MWTDQMAATMTKEPEGLSSFKLRVMEEMVDLLLSKNAAYGSKNLILTGQQGVIVRLVDKCYRFENLVVGGAPNQHESMVDTFRDIIGYCVIWTLIKDGKWGPSGEELRSNIRKTIPTLLGYYYPWNFTIDALASRSVVEVTSMYHRSNHSASVLSVTIMNQMESCRILVHCAMLALALTVEDKQ